MDKDKIKELLGRFFDGTTTREEEELLIRYFDQEDIPEEWSNEKQMFQQLATIRHTQVPIPSGLEERLGKQIDVWAEREKKSVHPPLLHHRRIWWSTSIAACLLLAGSISLKILQPAKDTPLPPDLTPQMALTETERALYLFSSTLNKGVKQMTIAQQTTQRVQENINQTLNRIK